jgi:hypothetical protein
MEEEKEASAAVVADMAVVDTEEVAVMNINSCSLYSNENYKIFF